MQSAFGVEHGDEIAKFGAPSSLLKPVKSLGSAMGGGATKAGQKLKPLTPGVKTGMRNTAQPKPPGGLAGARNQTGGALRRAGSWMSANPGATGGAALGVAGGAAGGAALSNRRRY